MRNDPNKQARENERILSRLERSYDKGGDPSRKFHQDHRDVTMLLRRGAIDYAHADILRDQINVAFAAHKRNEQRKPTDQDAKYATWFVGIVTLLFVIYFFV